MIINSSRRLYCCIYTCLLMRFGNLVTRKRLPLLDAEALQKNYGEL